MCSVVGCVSSGDTNQRFKLPEDPERRLEWVQFLATVNKQRFKESSWTDIAICRQHFKDDCFENLTPSHPSGTVQLKPEAVPSLCVQPESDEPDADLKSQTCDESVETEEIAPQCDQLDTESALTSVAAQETPVVPCGVSCSTDAFISLYSQLKQNHVNIDVIKEKVTLLKMKGKYIVNEKRLLQLFSSTCPLCGGKLHMEVTSGVLLILNQQCLQCEYRNQWKSQVNASDPTAEDKHLTGGTAVTSETQQTVPTDDNHGSITAVSEIVTVIDEQSDPVDESESSDEDEVDSDEEWKPLNKFLASKERPKESDDEDESEEIEEDDYPPLPSQHSQLCTECGKFFNKWRSHTCEHKIKPYSCNTCGKRCVSETALNSHGRVHDDNYEHRCKYCHVTFKTKGDKMTHEKIHLTQGKPYKCPDCSETFATNKDRRIHLEDHRGPRQLKCDICGIEFLSPLNLQRHKVVHTGLRPFKCSVCQRGFNQAGHLKSHMRLHTGERPYKCQHCDKRFNHNVSLKSHVQRYHTSSSGCEQKEEEINKRADGSGDAQENGSKRGSDSEQGNVEDEDDTDSDVRNDRTGVPKKKMRSTGRPIGRPKSSATGTGEGRGSNTKKAKVKLQKLKRTRCSDEESEDEQTDSHTSFDTAEKEEAKSKKARKSTNSDDSDFDPEERKKQRHSSPKSGKSSGKRRGRPRKNIVV
ncbi:uncharacterized protein [Thunnus thynnus]|uniref:uncharacterized protein n=1 Tax=Thunnus thynnus TaxID=8237 RepID=UPI003526DD05